MGKPSNQDLKKKIVELEKELAIVKKSESTLQISNNSLNRFIDIAPDIIYRLDSEGKIIYINDSVQILGFSSEELLGKNIINLIHPEDRDAAYYKINERRTGNRSTMKLELKFLKKNNSDIPFEDKSVGVEDFPRFIVDASGYYENNILNSGEFLGTVGIARDISVRKQYEAKLQESLNSYRYLFENNPMPMIIADNETMKILNANNAAINKYGYSFEEFTKLSVWDIRPSDEYHKVRKNRRKLKDGLSTLSDIFRHKKKDGTIFEAEVTLHTLQYMDRSAGLALINDVSELKRTEVALRRSEESLKLAQSVAHIGSWDWDIENDELKWSNELYNQLGLNPGEPEPTHELIDSFLHEEDREFVHQRIEEALSGKDSYSGEARICRKDGTEIIVYSQGIVMRDNKGKPVRLIGAQQDITERKKMDEKLIQITKAVESTSEAIEITDANGRHIYHNRAFTKLFEYKTAKELESCGGSGAVVNDPVIAKELFDSIKSGKSWSGELEMVTKSGLIFPAHESADAIIDGNSKIIGFMRIISDITECKKMQKELKDSEEMYRDLVETTSAIAWEVNLASLEFIYISPQIEKLTGYPLDSWKNFEDWANKIHPEDKESAVKYCLDQTAVGKDHVLEYRMLDSNGGIIWIKDIVSIIREEGQIVTLRGFFIDVSDIKQAEIALIESEQKYRSFVQQFMGISFRSKIDLTPEFFHGNVESISGYKEEDFLNGKPKWTDLIHPEEICDIEQNIERLKKEPNYSYEIEYRIIRKDGDFRWVRDRTRNICNGTGQPLYFQGTINDITEQKQAEKQVKDQDQYYRLLLNSIQDDILVIDRDYVIQDFSKKETTSEKENRKDIIGRHCFEVSHHFDKPCAELGEKCLLEQTFSTGKANQISHTHYAQDGTPSYCNILYSPIMDENGDVTGVVESVRNIDELMKAQNELAKSEKRFRNIFEKSRMGMMVTDIEGMFMQVNKSFCDMTGYSETELLKMNFKAITYTEDFNTDIRLVNKMLKGRRLSFQIEKRYIHKNGSIIWVSLNASILRDDKMKPLYFMGQVENITKQKIERDEKQLLQAQLLQAQKMESIGRLAGGIAHDFNNVLMSVMGYAELLAEKFPDSSVPEGHAVSIILEESEKAAHLIKQLLGFAREGKYNPESCNINIIILNNVNIAEKIFEKKIEVLYELDGSIDNISADVNQLDQMLMNMIINAKDAMPLGGQLNFKTENVQIGGKDLAFYTDIQKGKFVKITIKDSGIGMSKEVSDQIFEPFYTTKGRGKGTGLGLATVYGIIKKHNGYISVDSIQGKGTTFSIFLPTTLEKEKNKMTDKTIILGKGTILIIDDEKNVRQLLEGLIKSLGYDVLVAECGKDAIKLYKEKQNEIDMILLDMIMPDMDGAETFIKLKEINQGIQVLLISGYSKSKDMESTIQEGAIGFIQKPFKKYDISKILSEILNK